LKREFLLRIFREKKKMKFATKIYLLWFIINLALLFFSGYIGFISEDIKKMPFWNLKHFIHNYDVFFPFQTLDLSYYDITEFVVYLIVPYIIYKILRRE